MPISGDAESHGPRRPAPSLAPAQAQASGGPRLYWRAVVHAGQRLDVSRTQQLVAWHLAGCAEPDRPEGHCQVGRLLMGRDGNPDGHCQIDGACPRCSGPGAAA